MKAKTLILFILLIAILGFLSSVVSPKPVSSIPIHEEIVFEEELKLESWMIKPFKVTKF